MRTALLSLALVLPGLAFENTRSLPVQEVKTPAGSFRVTGLSVKAAVRTELTGTLVNDTSKTWETLVVQIDASDGGGNSFGRPLYLRFFNVSPHDRRVVSVDIPEKFDFDTLACSISYKDGSYSSRYQFQMLEPTVNDTLQFSDDLMAWRFVPQEERIALELANKSDKSATLDWNHTVYIDGDGRTHKVTPGALRYSDLGSAKSLVLPAGTNMREQFFLPDHVISGGDILPIFPKCPACRALRGAEFKLVFPVEIGASRNEYTFRFGVKSVE